LNKSNQIETIVHDNTLISPSDKNSVSTNKNDERSNHAIDGNDDCDNDEEVHLAYAYNNGTTKTRSPSAALLNRDRDKNPIVTPYNMTRPPKTQSRSQPSLPQMKPSMPYDSYKFSDYISSPNDYIAYDDAINAECPPAYSHLSSWTRARFNPDDADFVIDKKTVLFRPLEAERPEYGDILCHPVCLNDVYVLRDFFISHFRSGPSALGYLRSDPKKLKNFQEAFPLFTSDDVDQYFHWHNDLM
jgi:hypothetical protein